ncbi:MAG TPA: helix-hairpin-helix domain-containing protein [Flavisolibacter sp.]|jgi:DNA polymerase (family 10)|nr:helix-hairpin-helix domain-containing protein [Flavisolibacter sp.]
MDNYEIADKFSLLAKLMDIHGENSFKSKTYSSAAFAIEKLPQQIASLSHEKIFQVRGIGESVGKKVIEILENGEMQTLREYIINTPSGVLEMMNIKGLGPKKINTLWKEMKIDSIEELQKACEENLIATKKGFGEKTQQNILESIQFQKQSAGKYLYKKVESFAIAFTEQLKGKFSADKIEITGEFRRQLEIIESLEWVTTISSDKLKNYLLNDHVRLVVDRDGMLVLTTEETLFLHFHIVPEIDFYTKLFETSCSDEFLNEWTALSNPKDNSSEEKIFSSAEFKFIPPYLRESKNILLNGREKNFDNIVQTSDIKGLIHSHSNWSDGSYTIEEMAAELIHLGFEYLVISDHSKSAGYANGLTEQRIREQHRYIDDLNKKFAPFKIFKSIECDILGDGSLDYENKILSTFDLVITSIHSNLDMDEEKAMKRLIGAITNPYTTILGHMTGRLLLKRKGYPVDHKTIIDACTDHHVVIEINASPSRLDMDWRWIDYAMEKGLTLSINPDAHTIEEFHNVKYGVLVAQKGALTKSKNLSSYSLKEFEEFLQRTKKIKGIS